MPLLFGKLLAWKETVVKKEQSMVHQAKLGRTRKVKVMQGKPYAGNPRVRFDEGEVAPTATPRRGSLLYTTGKRIAYVLFGISAVVAMSGRSAECLAIGSGSRIHVVVPTDRILAEKTAAEELVAYVAKATGEKPAVVSEDKAPECPAIHLGSTAFARKAVPDLDRFGEEEWTVKTVDGSLVIAGGRPRGVLYGVYHFLEDVVGVRWLSPVAEYVPSRPQLRLEGLDLRGRPAMPYRSICLVGGPGASAFLARNRMNVDMNVDVSVDGAKYGFGRMFGGSGSCHTLYTNLGGPDEIRRLYKEHPDWFPLIDGKRKCDTGRANTGAQSQLCLTNPELRRHWIDKLRERIRADRARAEKDGVPPPRYYAIDQTDCYDGFCKCQACAEIAAREKSNAGILLDFANHVAEALEAEAPGAMFQMMALHSTEKPPKFLKARRNVTVRLCDTTSNQLAPWTDPQNAKHLGNLKAWVGHADSISMWDYQITFGTTAAICQPTPSERTFEADIRTLRDCKGDGFFFEHEAPVASDMRDLKVWLEFKLVENPDLDGVKLIREFTDLYYGPAAGAEVRKCRDLLGAAADAAKARVGWFPLLSDYSFISAETLLACYLCRDAALAAVKDDAEKTAHVEHAFMSVDRYYLARSIAMRRQMEKTGGDTSTLPAVQDVADRYRRIFDREVAVRGLDARNDHRKKDMDEFFAFVDKARELPVPERFKAVPKDALFLIPATFAFTHYKGMKFVDDSSSPAGCALTANMGLVLKNPHKQYPLSVYDWPLKCKVWHTMDGTTPVVLGDLPEKQPDGYHWYQVGKGLKLKPESAVSLWPDARVLVDGVVCDNSELGQKYDIYASIKIEGGDVYATGKATADTVYYVDQVAVVRKTLNSAGSK